MSVDHVRETALKILYDINEKGAYSNISINRYLEAGRFKDVDRAFITELVYGTIKWKLTLDHYIEQFSSVKLKKLSPWILNILRMGAYQLFYTDRVPPSAACNESVKLAKRYGHKASGGFVNAVLRNMARSPERLKLPDRERNLAEHLSIKYSHPGWMVKEWLDRFGEEFTEKLLDSNNRAPDLVVRVNTLKTDRDGLMEALRQEGLEVEEGKYAAEAVIIKNTVSVARLKAFKEGLFQVQDESSMLVAHILDPRPGELVMDACSAPGGKATHIAQLMNNEGTVIARDIHEHKISIIEENASRLGINIIKAEIFDAEDTDETYIGKADRVLVDAPCTGLGIIRRKPDIKWTRSIEDRDEIVRLQMKILDAASRHVRPGGVLVYSTCTIEPRENQDVVRWFLESHPEFRISDITHLVPGKLRRYVGKDGPEDIERDGLNIVNERMDDINKGYIQLYPNVHGTDGFFISRMERTG